MDKLYTTKEVAEMLKVKKTTIWNWIRQGKLKSIQLSSRIIRIREEDLNHFLQNSSHEE